MLYIIHGLVVVMISVWMPLAIFVFLAFMAVKVLKALNRYLQINGLTSTWKMGLLVSISMAVVGMLLGVLVKLELLPTGRPAYCLDCSALIRGFVPGWSHRRSGCEVP